MGGSLDFRRRDPRRESRIRILILCEGGLTEAEYFRAFSSELKNRLVRVEIDAQGRGPRELVESAVKRKKQADQQALRQQNDFLRFDEVWCVFDVDEHHHLFEARQQARDSGIDLAVSNPCFELWALLHFQAQTSHLERQHAQKRLRRHLPDYDKELPFHRLKPHYATAVDRARELDRRCDSDGEPGRNPSTGVHRLTERIRKGEKG